MKLEDINNLIDDLEEAEPSLSNIKNLAALYNVRTNLLGMVNPDRTSKELNDILPSYIKYIDTKRKYQIGELTKEAVHINMKELCLEI